MIKNLIFDFDGTIADTFERNMQILAKVAKVKFTEKELKWIRNHSAREVLKFFKVSRLKLLYLQVRVRQAAKKKKGKIPLFKDMVPVVRQCTSHFDVYVVSSSPQGLIRQSFRENNLHVHGIAGSASLLKKSRKIKKTLKKYKLKSKETLYIGDEIRDVHAAKEAGIKCIAVTWGYTNGRALKNAKPEFIAKKPADILKILRKHNKSFK